MKKGGAATEKAIIKLKDSLNNFQVFNNTTAKKISGESLTTKSSSFNLLIKSDYTQSSETK